MDFEHYVVWGYRNSYHTHSHIHEGLYRALAHLFPGRAEWLDEHSNVDVNRPSTFFMTNWDVSLRLPVRDDCFYCVHGLDGHRETMELFGGKKAIAFNQYIDYAIEGRWSDGGVASKSHPIDRNGWIWLGEDAPYHPGIRRLDIRWATDLLPHEIEANKSLARPWRPDSQVIHYVGTYWRVNEVEINQFQSACQAGGVELRHHGGGQARTGYSHMGRDNVVSPEDNARLVRESYFAPAIVGSHHLTEGYAPCRIFKNISYGAFGVTNSEKVQRLFGGRLIHNSDPYRLFFDARDRLPGVTQEQLFELMDLVRDRHTYVNRLQAVLKAAELAWEG